MNQLSELERLQKKFDRLQKQILHTQKQLVQANNRLRTLSNRSFLWKATNKAIFALDKKKYKLLLQLKKVNLSIEVLEK